jgi:hypothetical protein
MKVQSFELEPRDRPVTAETTRIAPRRNKRRVMLLPITGETRLFHAL